jgi:hypothetical protein
MPLRCLAWPALVFSFAAGRWWFILGVFLPSWPDLSVATRVGRILLVPARNRTIMVLAAGARLL